MITTFSDATRSVDVNVESGNLLLTETDLADANGTYHVVYRRSYNSLSSVDGIIGKRWVLDVSPQVFITQAGSVATVHGSDGFDVAMDDNGDGTYTAIDGFDGTLTRASNGAYTLTRGSTGEVFTFNSQGVLTDTVDAAGRAFTVTNTSAAGKTVLSSYGTADGRRINVSYNGDTRVREIDDPASTHRYYTYTPDGYLATYSGPAGLTTYTYNASGYLTAAAWPDGTTLSVAPLNDGRTASVTVHRPGTADQTWTFDYSAHKTVVTAPDGTQTTYYFGGDDLLVDEPDMVDESATWFADQYGVSQAVAEQWVVTQDRTDGVQDDITDSSAGPGLGGVWFDNDTRRVKVGVRSDAPAGVVDSILANHLVAGDADVVAVDYSLYDLEHAKPGLDAELADLSETGLVSSEVDTAQNAILIEVAAAATAAQRQRIADAAANSTVRVLVENSSDESLASDTTACSRAGGVNRCGLPFRGGVYISSFDAPSYADDNTIACTAGFIAQTTSGVHYLITAGHCLTGFDEDETIWSYEDPQGLGSAIGDRDPTGQVFGSDGDVGLIKLSSSLPVIPAVYIPRSSTGSHERVDAYTIRGTGENLKNRIVCLSGAQSGTHCGVITGIDKQEIVRKQTSIGFVVINGTGELNVCGVVPGDSGAPIVIGHRAYGIVSARKGCTVNYTGARTAQHDLDVAISTRLG